MELFILLWLGDLASGFSNEGFIMLMITLICAGGGMYIFGSAEGDDNMKSVGKKLLVSFAVLFSIAFIVPTKETIYIGLGVPIAVEVANETSISDTAGKALSLLDAKLTNALEEYDNNNNNTDTKEE